MSAYNGSGTFVITGVGLPYVTNTTISSTVANQLNTDLATGLSTAICKDGQTTTTAIVPFALGVKTDILSPVTANGPVALTAGQLAFPATQNPSSDANTLDDYEEGTWTPSVGGTATYTAQTGTYTKIGRTVNFRCSLIINAIGTGSQAVISGLPFSATIITSCSVSYFTGLALAVTYLSAYVTTTVITFTGLTAAATSIGDNFTALTSGTRVEVSGTYQV